MILYHFTDLWSLHNAGPDAILAAGLKAHDHNGDYPMFAGRLRPCVWFTSEPELSPKFQKAGTQEVRIAVEIPAATKRLVSWPKLLQRTIIYNETRTAYDVGLERFERMERDKDLRVDLGREPTDAELRAWRYWWVHFGDVPLKWIRAVEYSDPKMNAGAIATTATATPEGMKEWLDKNTEEGKDQ